MKCNKKKVYLGKNRQPNTYSPEKYGAESEQQPPISSDEASR
jgi:hypothetical protein